ncbi:MAG TPA: hypothetical protein ENN67_05390 [Firmicutes bacterium]|nr:hypothetical protein [Bacillota bacterium]
MPRGNGTGPPSGNRRGGQGQGGGQGRGGAGFGGPGGNCVCPSCGHKQQHIQGQPCNSIKCPKCGAPMTRE